jgi:F-type H+-transporting ATPase subunit b
MSLNLTLIGQMITFMLLVFFTMKFIWPPVTKALEDRQKRIAEGLAASDRGQELLADARLEADGIVAAARREAVEIIGLARSQASDMVDQARSQAKDEGERQLAAARARIATEARVAREELRRSIGSLSLEIAGKVLRQEMRDERQRGLYDEAAGRLG